MTGRRKKVLVAAVLGAAALAALVFGGCGDNGASLRRKVREVHMPHLAKALREDIARHLTGVQRAADRIAPGFGVPDPAIRERQVRVALKKLRVPPRGVMELVASPMSFMAAVDASGIVVARDAEPDRMKGMNLARLFPVVRRALAGSRGYDLGEFASLERGGEPSVTVLFAAPSRVQGRVVGAVVVGIPLWRLSQRMTKQLQVETAGEPGTIVWAYIYRGNQVFHHGTPPDIDAVVPNRAARNARLATSPGGYTDEMQQFGFWYGYGVMPLPRIAPDVGLVVYLAKPQ